MNLYAVRLVTHIVVSAPDEESAKAIALQCEREERRNAAAEEVRKVVAPSDLPVGWDDGCLPWGRQDDVTIGEIIGALTIRQQAES